jgi:hypothetical protein
MEPLERKVFLNEIMLQCGFALLSFKRLTSPARPEDELFHSAHSFLVHAANVASILWPQRPMRLSGEDDATFGRRKRLAEERGEELRHLLSVSDRRDPVLGNRQLRNLLEHFDFQLDQFLHDKKPELFVDRIVRSNFIGFDIQPELCLRGFATSALEFIFLGQRFQLKPLADALKALQNKTEEVAKKPSVYSRWP